MALRRKPMKGGPIAITKIALRVQKDASVKLRKILSKEFSKTAKAWRLEAKTLLSGPCYADRGTPNETSFPGRCSGDLERSLKHRTYVTRRQESVISAGWGRQFTGTQNANGVDYSKILENSYKKYGGYQRRIYESLDERMTKIMAKYHETEIGRDAWLRT